MAALYRFTWARRTRDLHLVGDLQHDLVVRQRLDGADEAPARDHLVPLLEPSQHLTVLFLPLLLGSNQEKVEDHEHQQERRQPARSPRRAGRLPGRE